MALDPLNNLDTFPLLNLQEFIDKCLARGIKEINLTGSNTDPLLYKFHGELCAELRSKIPDVKLGIRTNGVLALTRQKEWRLYDKASISITSFDPAIYKATMGQGMPPCVFHILKIKPEMPIKVNVVLCPETISGDVFRTLDILKDIGVTRVNLREPYGQPHLGCPISHSSSVNHLGMPVYDWREMEVTYWDVHYVEVESVNLYANGVVSETYPITKGHSPDGEVVSQDKWRTSGRQVNQWVRSP